MSATADPNDPPMPADTAARPNSAAAFRRALKVIPGGVNSPARAFGAVGGTPVHMASGEGPFLTDVDGNRYVDFVGSGGRTSSATGTRP